MKDMNGKIDLYRANAVRVLCKILGQDSGGGSLLVQIERYLKQAIVDKNPIVASSALCSGLHLLKSGQAGVADVVKRWSNEIQEAVHSKSPLVQFHALARNATGNLDVIGNTDSAPATAGHRLLFASWVAAPVGQLQGLTHAVGIVATVISHADGVFERHGVRLNQVA